MPSALYCCCAISNFSTYKGITSALVGLLAQKAEVKYDPTQISPEQIAAGIAIVGYEAVVVGGDDEKADIDLLVG